MPRAKNSDKKLLFNKLNSVWSDLTFADWLSIASELKPDSMWSGTGNIKGRCPFHEETTPSFVISPAKKMAKCFGTCNKTWFNPISFVAALQSRDGKGNAGEAIQYLRKRFNLKTAIPDALYEKVKEHADFQAYKNLFANFFCNLLFKAMEAYPNLDEAGLDWARPTVEYLMARDLGGYAPTELRPVPAEDEKKPTYPADPYGIWFAIEGSQLLGVFPPESVVLNQFGEHAEETQWFKEYFAAYLGGNSGQAFIGFLVFPLHDDPGSVCRFKVRKPSSDPKDKIFLFVEDKYEEEMGGFRGIYGLHHYRTFLGAKTINDLTMVENCIVVEGEFDALACIAQQIARQRDDFVVFATGGASLQSLDRYANIGIRMIHILQDRDRAGQSETREILKKTKHKDLSFRIFNWPDEYATWRDPANTDLRIKDPDDAIKRLGYPKFARYVNSTGENGAYWSVQEWCFNQASEEISQVAADDIKRRSNVAVEWGRLLRNPSMVNDYCKTIDRAFGLDATLLQREIATKDEGEIAFLERLVLALKEVFHVIGVQRGENRKKILHLWHKAKKVTEQVVHNDERSIETMLSNYYGNIVQFVIALTGEPSFMTDGEESLFSLEAQMKRYRFYTSTAFMMLAQGAPMLDHAETRAQGFHFLGEVAGELHSYLVNGIDVYHMIHSAGPVEEGETGRFEVIPLDGPSHNGLVFNNTGKQWLTLENSTADFTRQIDLVGLYNRSVDIVDSGWTFRSQKTDCQFLGTYLMSLGVMPMFKRQVALMLNAEHESGKSRFVAGLVGGGSFPTINVIASALTMHGYTAASIRQDRNNSTLCLCLEEFEDYGTNDTKSMRTRSVLEVFRDIISESPVKISIGTTTGEARQYSLRFPICCCAIRPLRDAASLSRFVVFELVKDPKRTDPVIALRNKFKSTGISALRQDLAVALFRYIPRLLQLQMEIEDEYAASGVLPAHASSRFRESLYPILAVMKLVREVGLKTGYAPDALPDYRAFAYAFVESRKGSLSQLKTAAENELVFEAILSSPIRVEQDADHMSAVTSIRNMLIDPNNISFINKTQMGVYLDVKREWLIVHWLAAQQGVLSQSRFKAEPFNFLKAIADRSPFCVTTEEARDANVLNELADVIGPCVAYEQVSVFRVDHLLAAARKRREEALAAPVVATTKPELNVPGNTASVPGKPETDGKIIV